MANGVDGVEEILTYLRTGHLPEGRWRDRKLLGPDLLTADSPAAQGSWNIPYVCRTAFYLAEGDPAWLQRNLTHELAAGFMGRELGSRRYGPLKAAPVIVGYEHARRLGHNEEPWRRWLEAFWELCTLCAVPWSQGQRWLGPLTVAMPGMRCYANTHVQCDLDPMLALALGRRDILRNPRRASRPYHMMLAAGGDFGLSGVRREELLSRIYSTPRPPEEGTRIRTLTGFNVLRTDQGIAAWVEDNLHSQKGPTFAVVSTPARTVFLHPHPDRVRGGLQGRCYLEGRRLVAEGRVVERKGGAVVWDRTETADLPGGRLLWHVRLDRGGLRRIG